MKEAVIILITISLLISCNSRVSESNNNKLQPMDSTNIVSVNNSDSPNRDSITPTKIGGLEELSFKFNVDTPEYILKTITIYSDKKVIQRIIANKEYGREEPQLIDWNFDGYKDITVNYNCGSGGCAYWIWNYSPTKKKYIYNKELSEVLGLEIDTANQYIVFHYRFGGEWEKWDSMKYKDNKLIFAKGLYSETWNDSSGNYWTKNKYSKMINNNVVVTKIDSFITK